MAIFQSNLQKNKQWQGLFYCRTVQGKSIYGLISTPSAVEQTLVCSAGWPGCLAHLLPLSYTQQLRLQQCESAYQCCGIVFTTASQMEEWFTRNSDSPVGLRVVALSSLLFLPSHHPVWVVNKAQNCQRALCQLVAAPYTHKQPCVLGTLPSLLLK